MEDLQLALIPYVSDFLAQARGSDLKQTPIPDSLSQVSTNLEIHFKTSFGMGTRARIPWLACFRPGQSAGVAGVYPVLLFRTDNDSLSVAYGVSATAAEANGNWPRTWPDEMVNELEHFQHQKYEKSFNFRTFAAASTADVDEIVRCFSEVIEDFLNVPLHQPVQRAIAKSARPVNPHTVSEFHDAHHGTGLHFSTTLAGRFLGALLTKPLCILGGLAGSGKTKLAEAFAIWISESAAQYRIVAVGADWTSNEQMLGYADALTGGHYRKPANGALDVILAAAADPERPHFLILDEMNLSHVERYFADMLSAIESSNAEIALHAHNADLPSAAGGGSEDEGAMVPARIKLPRNLFIIGTVNVDETTYMFSPKVLDRANVIEFRATADQLANYLERPQRIDLTQLHDEGGCGLGAGYGEAFVAMAGSARDAQSELGADWTELNAALLKVFKLLAEHHAEFGFRTAYEMVRFVCIHKQLSGEGWQLKHALDAQVLQKLMPRLHGSQRKLEPVLKALEGFCAEHDLQGSLEKIGRMKQRLAHDGFANAFEA